MPTQIKQTTAYYFGEIAVTLETLKERSEEQTLAIKELRDDNAARLAYLEERSVVQDTYIKAIMLVAGSIATVVTGIITVTLKYWST